MRLWSIHPSYLDSKGLVALWRECLLAQKVLMGKTKGYKNHPQLHRFKNTDNPVGAIAAYLRSVAEEADKRGYNFDSGKISNRNYSENISVSDKQIEYEFKHLLKKLKIRDKKKYLLKKDVKRIKLHPLFIKIKGEIEEWEIV